MNLIYRISDIQILASPLFAVGNGDNKAVGVFIMMCKCSILALNQMRLYVKAVYNRLEADTYRISNNNVKGAMMSYNPIQGYLKHCATVKAMENEADQKMDSLVTMAHNSRGFNFVDWQALYWEVKNIASRLNRFDAYIEKCRVLSRLALIRNETFHKTTPVKALGK